MNNIDIEKIQGLEDSIAYVFKDKNIALKAITHKSYANDYNVESNERLEFLGDSILEYVIATQLYFSDYIEEGNMTKKRAYIVREESLYQIANKLNFEKYIRVGKSFQNTEIPKAILADMVEAVIAGIYLDSNLNTSKEFILNTFHDLLKESLDADLVENFKSAYQEHAQSKGIKEIEYIVIKETGPDHEKTFEVQLLADGNFVAFGNGKTKKEAQSDAARKALEEENLKTGDKFKDESGMLLK